jgi:hypothetical protein
MLDGLAEQPVALVDVLFDPLALALERRGIGAASNVT